MSSHTLRLPANTAGAERVLTVQYTNDHPEPVTIIFPPGSIQVLPYAGSFEANLARALVILFFHLAFLGAVGVTAGCLFSMPVAAFFSLFTMILLKFIPYIESMAGRDVLSFVNDAKKRIAEEVKAAASKKKKPKARKK